jgi:hypothetical protein
MLGDRGLSHREGFGQLHDRGLARREPGEDRPSRGIGKGCEGHVEMVGMGGYHFHNSSVA